MDCKNISCCFSTSVDTKHRAMLFEITNRCNLACGYCHALGGKFTDIVLSDERIVNLIHEMAENHITKIIFSGGEPLLHKDIRKYVDIAEKLNMEVDICTNGTIMNDDILAWIKQHFSDITITLDTLDADVYARMKCCDKSMHAKAMESIKRLIKAGVKVGITIVPTSENYDKLEETIKYFSEIGVSAISILRMYKMEGASRYEFNEEALNKTIKSIVSPYDNIKFRLKGFGLEPQSMGRCPAGEGMLGIGYDGKLYPCLLLRNEQWSCDLQKMSLSEAINSDVFKDFVEMRHNLCNNKCVHNHECQYGCPAASYIEDGGFKCDVRCDKFAEFKGGN